MGKEIEMKHIELAVIGGGAAGLMAAITAARNGVEVTIFEKNAKLGKKLLITGKGRCNITNYCDVKELISNTPTNGKFMTNSFYQFDSFQLVNFLNELGLETKVERGNRVFPESDSAADVVNILKRQLPILDVKKEYSSVKSITKDETGFVLDIGMDEKILADKVIIATGGKSYPGTGSTGDGYKFCQQLGHKIIQPTPGLCPLEATSFIFPKNVKIDDELKVADLMGLSLRNAGVTFLNENGKKIYDDFGEMLFTHFGVSGPVILSASSHLKQVKDNILRIDLKPALSIEQLDARLQRDFTEHSRKKFENVLKNLLPRKLIPVIITLSGIPADKHVHQITRQERANLNHLLKNMDIKLDKFRPIAEAIITRGGVDVKEVNPKTMESKLVSGLYIVGELLDVDAYTGGFNLQIAWSSGYSAGMSV